MKVIIAAAGTGGHINPGIAIANKIKKEQPDSNIMFIGTTRGLENDLVPRAGYELKTIEAYGLSKKISVENVKRTIKTIKGMGQARKIVKAFQPDIVIGTGGYICGATIMAAQKYKIPTILHESNAFPGKAVKMLSNKVDTILVGFEDAKNKLPNAKNIVLTGTPTKTKKMEWTREQQNTKKIKLGFEPEKPMILVFGGSQGAKAINEALLQIIETEVNQEYQIMWAAGPVQYDVIKSQLKEKGKDIKHISGMKIVPYIYDMEEAMNLADIVVARSGAITITEVAKLGKPAIFIPLPNVSQNHQEYNAKVLVDIGAARMIKNQELNGEILNKTIIQMLKHKETLNQMGKIATSIACENVEEKIYQEILKLVKKAGT